MRLPLPAQDASPTVYVVAAPCRSDVMSATLRSAYASPVGKDPFADLMLLLDRIETRPLRT